MTRPLRILHIASGDLWAGAEVQAFTLMSRLACIPDTEVAAVLMNDGELAERLRSVGITAHIFDEAKNSSLRIMRRLREVLRSWRPDIVHTHRVKENILGSLANRSCNNVPSVRTVHGAMEQPGAAGIGGVRHRLLTRIDRWCGRTLQQRVIAVTRELGTQLMADFPPEKVVIIENGVDFEAVRQEMRAVEFRLAEPDTTHIGIAGRLVAVKRVDIFIEAAALLLREQPGRQWRFHVFGEGPLRLDLEEMSKRLQMEGKMVFHGHRQDIAACVGGLDALVICSDHEGMPMISLEAVALGVPTVAHAVGGLIHVVPAEFLVTRHDAFGYCTGVLRTLHADARVIAARRATDVVTQFSAQRNAHRVRALYEQVVAESRIHGNDH